MIRIAKIISGIFCICFFSVITQAKCIQGDGVDFAKAFYEKHQDFYYADSAAIKDLLAPRLLATLEKDHKCSDGEICAIESNPWTSAQDGEIGKPIDFKLSSSSANAASVRMSYMLELGKTKKLPQSAELKLERNAPSSCWTVADLITPRDGSLRDYIEKWHKEYSDAQK
ncbi:hypothetical protein ELE36_12645 [Pseudolysobacter antarcticus]|uniref:DUF3828 domain-containing protein n=1 Tax=Pseudolysobacter antarcticus TaxID=2511995 RepID=A0A411HKS7_9GAMM|nr:hypothetical protein [Pseudolysobacter antarcticus]QBB71132.1 hypothetical protein ELE36_12645 [Pseudolysobacter antarcticus]